MRCLERDPSARAWRNTNPADLLKETEGWTSRDFTTISFAGRKLWDKQRERKLRDEEVIAKMITFYQSLSRRSKQDIHPQLFVSHWDKSLHFHIVECSSHRITRKARAQTFRKVFQKFHKWPKNLYGSVIHSQPYDESKGALFYSSAGHNQLFTTPFLAKRKPPTKIKTIFTPQSEPDLYTLELMKALDLIG
jgi:hypothetical protein